MASRSRRLPPGFRPPEASPEKDTLEHFERFAWTCRLENDSRVRLREFQLDKLDDYFARRAQDEPGGRFEPVFLQHLWLEPTGQGKSGLLGLLALHHATFVERRPRVFVLGGEAGQAQNTTNAAAGFVFAAQHHADSRALFAWWEPQAHAGGRLMPRWLDGDDFGIFARTAGRKVARKGGASVEGKNPTLILVEELHRHEDGGAAMDTLVTKTVKAGAVGRSAVRVVIVTTAGTDRQGKLGRLLDQVTDPEQGAQIEVDPHGRRDHYVRGIDADGETVGHIFAVPETVSPPASDDDLDPFLAEVKRANPADWITVRTLRRLWKTLGRFGRWQFLRQNACQWVAAGIAAIDRAQFLALRHPGLEIPAGEDIDVVVGLDRGTKWDDTAIVPVWRPGPDHEATYGRKVRVAGVVILSSPKNGTARPFSEVVAVLEQMRVRWPGMRIAFDRNAGGGKIAEDFENEHNLTVIDHGQGVEFDRASMRLGELVEERDLKWDAPAEHLEAFVDQVCGAVLLETARGRRWRGEAPDDGVQIDAFDGLAMAAHIATGQEETHESPAAGFQGF